MAVDTYTSDRLSAVEKQLHEVRLELQDEHFRRENTITWAMAWVPIVALAIIDIAVALARR